MKFFHRRQWLDSAHGSQDGAARLAEAAAEEAAAAAAMGVRRVGAVEDLRCLDEEIDRDASAAASRYAVDSRANVNAVQSSQMMLSLMQDCVLCTELGCLSASGLAVLQHRQSDQAGSLRKEQKRLDSTLRRQSNEKPSIIPGCPGQDLSC